VGILRLPRGLDYSVDMLEQRVGDVHLLNLIANLGQMQSKMSVANMNKVWENIHYFYFSNETSTFVPDVTRI
jgi:hypothetical protein